MRKLRDSVVVVTGASSGIGRATALEFARQGASVALAARRLDPLEEAAGECERLGGRSLVVQTDVTDAGQVDALARRTADHFGRLDVWVNNAAVTLFARFEDAPLEAIRRVIETNLFGYIYGARAALPYFREQGHGVLINNGSIVSNIPQPYTSAYVMSKHAIRALGRSLRQEIALDGAPLHVCTVLPATIDTPFFQHAANYTGRPVKAMPPVYPAELVARIIVQLAQKPRPEVFAGRMGRMLNAQMTLAPFRSERMLATMVDRQHLETGRRAPASEGNLFRPMDDGMTVGGGWGGHNLQSGGFGFGTAAMLLGPAALGWWWLRNRGADPGGQPIPPRDPADTAHRELQHAER